MKAKDLIRVGEPLEEKTATSSEITITDKEKVERLRNLALQETQLRSIYIELALLVFEMLVDLVDEENVNIFSRALEAKKERARVLGELQEELDRLGLSTREQEFEMDFSEDRVTIKVKPAKENEH